MSLKQLFEPKSIALIGASEKKGALGQIITANILEAGFDLQLFLVNPKYEHVFGKKTFSSILEINDEVELAIIVTKASTTPSLLKECGEKGVKAVIIISAGFKESSEQGALLEKEILLIAKRYQIRLLGPNCLGLINTKIGLNATFAATNCLKGEVAFLSQSGALCTAFIDWSIEKKFGFSVFVSLGSMSDIDFADLLEFLEEDENTKAIFMYIETIGDGKKFVSVASKIAIKKPIFVIKAGTSEPAAKAANSHTGALSGDDALFTFVMDQIGIKRLESLEELFNLAMLVAKQKLPTGKNLMVITNAGGPAVVSVDAALKKGANLAELSIKSIERLNQVLPTYWSHGNPIDLLGDALEKSYFLATETALEDSSCEALLIILTPQHMTEAEKIAQLITNIKTDKLILASWMGSKSILLGKKLLDQSSVACFDFPDQAAAAFATLATHIEKMKALKKEPLICFDQDIAPYQLEPEKKSQKILSETESKIWLEKSKIPTVKNYIAKNIEEANLFAKKIGYPVALKLHSTTLTHKSDVNGVVLDLNDEQALTIAYKKIEDSLERLGHKNAFEGVAVQKMILEKGIELIIGAKKDPQFGVVILFGAGGMFTEVYKDRSLALAPLNRASAKKMVEQTKIYSILKGFRGQEGYNLEQLYDLLVAFSKAALSVVNMKEIDINPLLITKKRCLALDARIILE